ncbi:hypothetical protein ACHAXR_001623, partial [Thalassiosira sp. AJA248-18]
MSTASISSSSRSARQPIHYRFISIDEECPPSSTPSSSSSEPSPTTTPPQCFSLLQQFYDELMVPTFPLEEERDDIEDWFECFRMQMKLRQRQIKQQHQNNIKEVLTEGLKEEGIASVVQRLAINGSDEEGEENFTLEGPAMDVILMVQENDNFDDGNEDGDYFLKRSRRSLLRSQSSLYGGLYTPTIKEDEANIDVHHDGVMHNRDGDADRVLNNKRSSSTRSSLSRQGSLYGGLYTPTTINEDEDNLDDGMNISQGKKKHIIIGGAAVEYYRQSRVGLLSYVVLHNEFRGCGLAKYLHKEALSRLELLANSYGTSSTPLQDNYLLSHSSIEPLPPQNKPLLQAVFAETNTPAAGDITPEQSLLRHKSLFNLGYRLVKFPYAQPPLTTEDVNASFDDIVLLVYFPFDNGQIEERDALPTHGDVAEAGSKEDLMKRYCSWFPEKQCCNESEKASLNTTQMNINIPFSYIEDFYQSVFGYDSEGGDDAGDDERNGEGIPDYRTANYYKLA